MQSMKAHKKIDEKVFDEKIKDWEWNWVNSHESYPDIAQRNPVATANKLYNKYIAAISKAY